MALRRQRSSGAWAPAGRFSSQHVALGTREGRSGEMCQGLGRRAACLLRRTPSTSPAWPCATPRRLRGALLPGPPRPSALPRSQGQCVVQWRGAENLYQAGNCTLVCHVERATSRATPPHWSRDLRLAAGRSCLPSCTPLISGDMALITRVGAQLQPGPSSSPVVPGAATVGRPPYHTTLFAVGDLFPGRRGGPPASASSWPQF